jgi:hypothetical protein
MENLALSGFLMIDSIKTKSNLPPSSAGKGTPAVAGHPLGAP